MRLQGKLAGSFLYINDNGNFQEDNLRRFNSSDNDAEEISFDDLEEEIDERRDEDNVPLDD